MRVRLSTALTINEAPTAMSYSPGDIIEVPGSDSEYLYAMADGTSRVGQPAIYNADDVSFTSKGTGGSSIAYNSAKIGIAQAAITDTYYGLWQIKGIAENVYKENAAVVAFQPFTIDSAPDGSYYCINNMTNTLAIGSVNPKWGYILSRTAGYMSATAGTITSSGGTAKIYLYGN